MRKRLQDPKGEKMNDTIEISEKLDHFLAEHQRHRPERYIAVPQYSAAQAMGI